MSLITARQYEEALRDWLGDRLEFFPGWRTADSAGSFNAHGFMHHWTAMRTVGRDAVPLDAQLMLLQRGRPGLDGPLCHLSPARDGRLWVVAGPTANANHAGNGDAAVWAKILAGRFDGTPRPRGDSIDGNERFYGLEYQYHPDDGTMPEEQIEAGILATAALAQAHGWDANTAAGSTLEHYEWTTRKIDRNVQNLADRTRAGVRAALLAGPNQEDDMPTPEEIATAVWAHRLEDASAAVRLTRSDRNAHRANVRLRGVLATSAEIKVLAAEAAKAAGPGADAEAIAAALIRQLATDTEETP